MKKLFLKIKSFAQNIVGLWANNGQATSDTAANAPGLSSLAMPKRFCRELSTARSERDRKIENARKRGIRAGLQSKGENPTVSVELIKSERSEMRKVYEPVMDFLVEELALLQLSLASVREGLKLNLHDRVRQWHQKLLPELTKNLLELKRRMLQKTMALNTNVEMLNDNFVSNKAVLLEIISKHGIFQKNKVLDSPFLTIAAVVFFVVIDIMAVKLGLTALHIEEYIGIGIAIALAGFTAFSAVKLAEGIAKDVRFDKVAGLSIGVLSILLATFIRYKGTELRIEEGKLNGGHLADIVMLVLSVLAFTITALFEAKRHKRSIFFNAQQDCHNALTNSAKLIDDNEHEKVMYEKEFGFIHDQYQAKVVTLACDEHAALVSKGTELEAKKRNALDQSKLLDEEVKDAEDRAEKAFVEGFMEGVANRNPIWAFNNFFTSTLTAGILLLASCKPAPQAEIYLSFDTTIERVNQNAFNAEGFPHFMAGGVLAINPEDAPALGVDVYYMELSELAMPPIFKVATLERGLPVIFSVKLDRVDAAMDFVDTLRNLPNTRFKNGNGLERSEICRPISQVLNRLSDSNATIRTLVVFSDAMEHAAVNFYALDIEHLDETSYQKIAEAFEKACPLRDLTGINIIWVYTPTIHNQGKVLAAQSIFKRYLETHGATVSFIPNF